MTEERPTEHAHEWKRADDWDWGPDTFVYECFRCRSLRIVRPDGPVEVATSPPPEDEPE